MPSADTQVPSQPPIRDASTGWRWPLTFLIVRLFLLLSFGLGAVGLFTLLQNPHPFFEVTRWWPFQVMLCNAVVYLLLRFRCSREHTSFSQLWGFDRSRLRHDCIVALVLIVPSALIGYLGVYLPQLLLYGHSDPPSVFYQPLPVWAAALTITVFPVSNALLESTTYFGYSASRLQALTRNTTVAVGIGGVFLALQHIAFPMLLEPKYILWRFLSFLAFALYVAVIYARMKRLTAIIPLHFLADLSTAIPIFVASVSV